MKQYAVRLLLLSFVAVALVTCKKGDDNAPTSSPPPTPPPSTWSFTAVVNGNTVHGTTVNASLFIDTSLGSPLRTFGVAALCGTDFIEAGFGDISNSTIPSVGNHDFGSVIMYQTQSDTVNDYNNPGHFSITSVDAAAQKVSGTFSGTVVGDVTGDTVVITNGVFTNIHYTVLDSIP